MKYFYYPGCSAETSAIPYDMSTREVARALDINLEELEDWNCCGATSYISLKDILACAVTARNLALAEKAGGGDIVAICNACYLGLKKSDKLMREYEDCYEKINKALSAGGLKYNCTVNVRHFLEVLVNDIGLEKIREKVTNPLTNITVACYTGCQLSRPYGEIDNEEFPEMMEKLMSAIGARIAHFPLKGKCCGGMLMSTAPDVALKLNRNILLCAEENDADCISTCCPLCQMNLEGYQGVINRKFNTRFNMPVLYFTQMVGVALGISSKKLGIPKNLVNCRQVLAKVG
ncbi:MAG: CoB--CoM heterodisulfide reductase iron-sulfur subunit B family protein [Candidatus Eremiobacteraeota bacterium]|nr:CoB--CoM heterodisulfide reductase iron-sulfur subunit B family protein [Candidatus Eremiobacteraeota bacterium]